MALNDLMICNSVDVISEVVMMHGSYSPYVDSFDTRE